jgi:hypothetical protein
MKDYVVFITAKNTLSTLRTVFYNGRDLEFVKKDVSYKPDTEDIYIYEVEIKYPLEYKTGPF